MMSIQHRKPGESGTALFISIMAIVWLVIPIAGLAVDTGVLYVTKARLQAAVDGASLAAARALTVGSTTASQAVSAKQNAVNWFFGNFPTGNWGTSGTQMDTTDTHVHVYDDATNPHLRHVDVMATTNAWTIFMKYLGFSSVGMTSYGYATRRDVAIMMVVDRSGSMCYVGAVNPGFCSGASATPCGDMVTAAKIFTGQFAEGRDTIGMVSFGDNAYMHSPPVTTFQTKLGFTATGSSGTGEIDTLACAGGTNTAQAISLAYNELYKLNLQGALNVIMFETDGLPNTVTVNFWDGTSAGLQNSSVCTDRNGIKMASGGFASASAIPYWQGNSTTPSHAMGSGSYIPDIPAGMVGGLGGFDPPTSTNYDFLFNAWTTSASNYFNEYTTAAHALVTGEAPNGSCMTPIQYPSPDLAWMPETDVYGNNLNTTYQSVTTSGGHITPLNMNQIRAAAFNAADSAAYTARTHNANLPVYFFGIGLGGNGGPNGNTPNYVLMQRMANDPNGDTFNSSPYYSACASEPGCVTYAPPSQPQGTFIYAPTTANLANAFLKLSSQILRLSK